VSVDRIELRGIEVFAHHGVLPHERRDGQRFVVDVELGLDLAPAAASDDLEDTVDYGLLAADVAALVATPPADLIEVVAERVAARCLMDARVQEVAVRIAKPQAPLDVVAREVAVTVRRGRG